MVMMVVMVAPEISVMMMVVMISKLEVIFRSRLFVHRVQERRRIGNRFQQLGKRIRLQGLVRIWCRCGLRHAERCHRAQ